MKVSDLTPYQKDMICNGCGSSKAIIRPPRAKFFRVVCDKHDLGYYLGWTEKHREKRDSKLKKDMFGVVNEEFKSGFWAWFNRRRYYTWCRAYYLAVRWQGKKHFYYGDGPQELPQLNEDKK